MRFLLFFISVFMVIIFLSCAQDTDAPITYSEPVVENMSDLNVDPNFNFATSELNNIRIKAMTNNGEAIKNVRFNLYDKDPDDGGSILTSGVTNQSGVYQVSRRIPTYLKEVVATTDYIGLVNKTVISIDMYDTETEIRGGFTNAASSSEKMNKPSGTAAASDFAYIGTYDANGVPDYLETNGDVIDQEFLNDINATFPENRPVPDFNPQYLASGNEVNTQMNETGEVFVTFVHEGAGYRNVLGYYTYPIGSPPATPADIDSVKIVFPNVSYSGSGGGLNSGDKVNLGTFAAGTEIGWVLIANGWNGSTVGTGNWIVFSEPSLNPETDADLKQHIVLLNDPARNIVVFGFEDILRDNPSCDQDFNDALFYVSSNPVTAINTNNLPEVTYTGDDSDGDGILDPVDDYPNDPNRAFDSYYPSASQFGTFAFEDLWPVQGDYDFNDLIIDYQYQQVLNAQNEMVEMDARFVISAVGAAYENGFGFQMQLDPALVSSVTGSDIRGSLISVAANGLEAGQSQSVIIVSDNVYNNLARPAGYYVNTQDDAPFVTPDTININIQFTQNIALATIDAPPFNPFIYINQNRDKEVHFPDLPPTDLADQTIFGTGDDRSDPGAGYYYKSLNNLPWAMDLTKNWDYPTEKSPIINAFNYFGSWAQSSGTLYPDWYLANSGYRNEGYIYNR
jgi:LruC domain-containing protein